MSESSLNPSQAESSSRPTSLKLPPQSVEAEQAVLGGLMHDNSAWDDVAETILAEDFYRKEHRLIFQAMTLLASESHPVDMVTVAEILDLRGELGGAGGLEYLGELTANSPSSANIRAYARIIRERSILRRLISVANDIADQAFNPGGRDSAELLDMAEQRVFNIADERPRDGGPQSLNPLLKTALEKIDTLFNAQGNLTGLSTGFKDLDEMTSGLQKSDLIIVAARPSMGKCIVSGSRLVDPASGERLSIDELVRRRQGRLHTLGSDWKLHEASPSAFVDDGIKPTFRVTTALGREIETTLTHPFLTEAGWKPLGEIRPGTRIGVPRELPVFGHGPLPEHQIKLLAYLAADGGLTGNGPAFTHTDARLLEEFTDCIARFGGLRVRAVHSGSRAPTLRVSADGGTVAACREAFAATLRRRLDALRLSGRALTAALQGMPATMSYWRQGVNLPRGQTLQSLTTALAPPPEGLLPAGEHSASRNGHNPLVGWLEKQGLWGKLATQKRIAPAVFRLPRPQLALFLNRLFACDGSASVQNEVQGLLSYASSSRELAREVQHLLLRFGILARLKRRQVEYQGGWRAAWELVVSHQDSVRRFIDEIGIFGKEEALARVRELLDDQREHAHTDSLPESACDYVLALKGEASWPEIFARKGLDCPAGFNPHLSGASRRLLSRPQARFFAELFDDDYLRGLADSDLYWDTVTAIEPTGLKQVYDLTVADTHNFVAEDVLVHNTTFAMNLVENAILHGDKPVLVFSLEMPADSLIIRMLSSVGRIDQSRMRSGKLEEEDWPRLSAAMTKLKDRPLFIDDTPGLSPMEMRSRARRIAREHGDIGLIMVDYLQLMQIKGSSENRTSEISEISRALKTMAREFNCPLIALSQLNRSLEQRPNKRPVMSDLRECVTGDTLVCLSDGRRVPIATLVGETPEVWALGEDLRLTQARSDKVWPVGRKPVFRLCLASGRELRATAEHRVYSGRGWKTLSELAPGDRIALARKIPAPAATVPWPEDRIVLLAHLLSDGSDVNHQPLRYTTVSEANSVAVREAAIREFGVTVNRHPGKGNWHHLVFSGNGNRWHPAGIDRWLRELGLYGESSQHKHLPEDVFRLPDEQIALLLRHLWATDGAIHVRTQGGASRVYFSTCSKRLALDVSALLLRLGIVARLRRSEQMAGKPVYAVDISGRDAQLSFLKNVGAFGARVAPAQALEAHLLASESNTNVDTLPLEAFEQVKQAMRAQGISQRAMIAGRGTAHGGSSHFRVAPSRNVLADYASRLGDEDLAALASSDLFWDRVVAIVPDGDEEVYDLTVPGPANWLADGMVVHNSGAIEQDADLILFIYRDEVYNPESEFKGMAEIIIGKHRNGPIGTRSLSFLGKYTRFENFAPASMGEGYPPFE